MTLEMLQRAAESLGLTASRKDNTLDVDLQPYILLRIRDENGRLTTKTGPVRGPAWLGTARVMLVGVALGAWLVWHQPVRLDNGTLLVLLATGVGLGAGAWVSWQSSRTKTRLFARAYDMERTGG